MTSSGTTVLNNTSFQKLYPELVKLDYCTTLFQLPSISWFPKFSPLHFVVNNRPLGVSKITPSYKSYNITCIAVHDCDMLHLRRPENWPWFYWHLETASPEDPVASSFVAVFFVANQFLFDPIFSCLYKRAVHFFHYAPSYPRAQASAFTFRRCPPF